MAILADSHAGVILPKLPVKAERRSAAGWADQIRSACVVSYTHAIEGFPKPMAELLVHGLNRTARGVQNDFHDVITKVPRRCVGLLVMW